MIDADVTVTQEGMVIRIAPARNPEVDTADVPVPNANPPSKTKIARPPNAFILYRQHHHPVLRARFPHLHNCQICMSCPLTIQPRIIQANKSAVILGNQWKQEPAENKAKFITLAHRLKAKHIVDHPDYHYKPRKPSEKKRHKSRSHAFSVSTTVTEVEEDDDPHPNPPPNPAPNPPQQISRTAGGNPVVAFGDEDLDDEVLLAALQAHNNAIQPALAAAGGLAGGDASPEPSAAVYDEPSQPAKLDDSFFNAWFDFDTYLLQNEQHELFEDKLKDRDINPDSPTNLAAFDAKQSKLQVAEYNRQMHMDLEKALEEEIQRLDDAGQ